MKKIKKIEILPFGAIIKMDMQTNISSIKLFLISSFGIVMQFFYIFLFEYLYNNGVMNDLTYQIFFLLIINLLFLFNIMPVVPLDGAKVLGSIFGDDYSL
ncbi:MAG: hypothetical protein L6V78_07155 [Clostridium sp.]|nr:MAG: hypothetical protein L6V78_07155 [Clostridium sp.]